MAPDDDRWPALPLADWRDTCDTLHMWTQVAGKIRLELSPLVNHWWEVPLYVTARGLTTSAIPYDGRIFDLTFDFVDHQLRIDVSDGGRRAIPLEPQSVADFYARVLQALRDVRIDVKIWPMPVEVPDPIRFDRDTTHHTYVAEQAHRFWRVLLQADTVMKAFRARFIGKSSPVHFFWGSFDLAVSRFSGRRAPERPDVDRMTRIAYSHEVISVGFWPGSGAVPDAAFYAYAAPEPAGFKTAAIAPPAASYNRDFGEFILMYEDVRRAASPERALMEFFETAYDVGATLGHWDRAELEWSNSMAGPERPALRP